MTVLFLGDSVLDEYYSLEDPLPKMGGKARLDFIKRVPGGMAANACCLFALFGERPKILTNLSSGDPSTQKILDNFLSYGVDVNAIKKINSEKNPTVMIFSGERKHAIFAVHTPHPVTGKSVPYASFDENDVTPCQNCDWVYTTLPVLKSMESKDIERFWRTMKRFNVPVFLDFDAQSTLDDLSWLLKASCVSMNEHGATRFFGNRDWEKELPLGQDTLQKILITKGALGASLYTSDGITKIPAFPNREIVDETGAGDAFNASFLFALNKGFSDTQSLEFAALTGAYVVGFQGPRIFFDPKNLEDFFRREFPEKNLPAVLSSIL